MTPLRTLSTADLLEQINVRLDDKLSRMMRGEVAGKDPECDPPGYLALKQVTERRPQKD